MYAVGVVEVLAGVAVAVVPDTGRCWSPPGWPASSRTCCSLGTTTTSRCATSASWSPHSPCPGSRWQRTPADPRGASNDRRPQPPRTDHRGAAAASGGGRAPATRPRRGSTGGHRSAHRAGPRPDRRAPGRDAPPCGRRLRRALTPPPFDLTTFPNDEGYDELVLARGIPIHSLCQHHLLPFSGVAHVGYLPGKRILGLSKLARVVDLFARDLQVQERSPDGPPTGCRRTSSPRASAW